ncbi:hypothetical protein [Rhizobium sp. RU36D]|uniref:hypothetical protein n=1 Tax=Rhizobium sp. RU36D TaxID=1907415 RepID=UPI0009D7BF99|nr:hypothetical protein [Rhizobium sp. RU36D]SMC42162.1 hypothetical protein SAMN05880593_101206 [Rhizobium sp. RU36D]
MQVNLSSSSMFALSRLLGERLQSATQSQDPSAADATSSLKQAFLAMNEVLEEGAEEQKARARQKLEDAKAQLEFLRRWHFDPAVVTQQAAALGQTVNAAAREFMDALGIDATGDATTVATADNSDTQTQQDTDEPEAGSNIAARAYQETMDDDQGKISSQDQKTLEEFKAIAQELKRLLEEAKRKLSEQSSADKGSVAESQTAIDGLGKTIASLEQTLSASVVVAPQISLTL